MRKISLLQKATLKIQCGFFHFYLETLKVFLTLYYKVLFNHGRSKKILRDPA